MTDSPTTELLLERLRQDTSRASIPQLDDTAILHRILDTVAREKSHSDVAPTSRRAAWPLLAVAGMAAALGLFVATRDFGMKPIAQRSPPARGELGASAGLDGTALAIDQMVVASPRDVTVSHPGRVTWKLRGGGTVRVVENDSRRTTLDLDDGFIQAEVVRASEPETFAIEVGTTRIAVHGTVFSVERRGNVAEVVVREGRVMVGRNDRRGSTQGTLLTGPSRAKIDVEDNHVVEPPSDAPSKRPESPPDPKPAPAIVPSAEHPSDLELQSVWTRVSQVAQACFASQTDGDPALRVRFSTELTITVGKQGHVTAVTFEPNVTPAIQACTLAGTKAILTNPSQRGGIVTYSAQLVR